MVFARFRPRLGVVAALKPYRFRPVFVFVGLGFSFLTHARESVRQVLATCSGYRKYVQQFMKSFNCTYSSRYVQQVQQFCAVSVYTYVNS